MSRDRTQNNPLPAREGRYAYLDAGRGLAALVVLWHHLMVFFGDPIEQLLARVPSAVQIARFVSDLNVIAVLFFFFISGWSIWISLGRTSRSSVGPNWKIYLLHRARRILPLYWISLVLAFVLTAGLPRPEAEQSMSTLLGNLVFLQTATGSAGTWFIPFAGNGPLWSLSYEVWYYVALPVIHLAIVPLLPQRLRSAELALMGSLVIAVCAIAANRLFPNPFLLFASLFPVWVTGFLFGRIYGDRVLEGKFAIQFGLGVAVLLGLSYAVKSDTLNVLLQGMTLALCVIGIVYFARSQAISHLMRTGVVKQITGMMSHIGLGSYAIYILHYPILIALAGHGVSLPTVGAVIAILVLLAPTFETQLQRHVNRLTDGLA